VVKKLVKGEVNPGRKGKVRYLRSSVLRRTALAPLGVVILALGGNIGGGRKGHPDNGVPADELQDSYVHHDI